MRRLLTAIATATLAAALPAVAFAFSWSITVSPTTVAQGQSTTFTFTMTNLETDKSNRLGCLEVDLPTSFVIESIGTPVASNGDKWVSSLSGNSVVVYSKGGGGRLDDGESVTFTITARPTMAGSFVWNNHAHSKEDCKGPDLTGTPLQITVVPATTPTSTPTPVATTTPAATPRPTSTPDSTPTSSPTPTATSSPTPTPGEPTSTPDPSASARPSPPAEAPSPGGTASGGRDALRMAPLDDSADGATDDLGTGLDSLDSLALLDDPFVWFVPGAAVGVPGLLVMAFVALQGVGAAAWIPAVRRLGGDDRRRRRIRPSWPS